MPPALPTSGLATRLWAAAGDSIAHVLAAAAVQDRPAPAAATASPWDPPISGGMSGPSAFLRVFALLNHCWIRMQQFIAMYWRARRRLHHFVAHFRLSHNLLLHGQNRSCRLVTRQMGANDRCPQLSHHRCYARGE